MKQALTILMLFVSVTTSAQIGFEQYYTTRQLTERLQQAATNSDKLEAHGLLAVHYKSSGKDSLGKIHMEKARALVGETSLPETQARLLWWENYYKGDTVKARKYIDFAQAHKLYEEEIAGYVELTKHFIHINLDKAEQYILTSKKRLDEWKADSATKDSVKLLVFKQLSHVYVHKKDGKKIISYLLPMQDYAQQDRNLMLKEKALIALVDLYNEWTGFKKSAKWLSELYALYSRIGNPNKKLYASFELFSHYVYTEDSINARLLEKETSRLWDSIGNYGRNIVWFFEAKHFGKMLTTKEYIELLDTDFKGRYKRDPSENIMSKIWLYSAQKNLDSVRHYLDAFRRQVGDAAADGDANFNYAEGDYYKENKQYNLAIPTYLKLKTRYRQTIDLSQLQWLNKVLAESYAGLGDYKSAYNLLDSAYILKDSLEKLEAKGDVSLMEMQKHEEIQAAIFDEERKRREAEASRTRLKSRIRTYGLLSGLIGLVVIAGILHRNNRQKSRSNLKIEKAYADLKATQAQLVQSEKMASLGELTAGIAHEIQNPLNFVNNFSEVSNELLDEMKSDLATGNWQQATSIVDDLKQNLEKINHHGKRADAIVKGMLQHSRSSSGQKEPTDMNALADEYLRLAYHGLRAKDNTFNATIKTDFQANLGTIQIIPQDIGRVILNLITNAFYAVTEKKKKLGAGYEPAVTVSTQKEQGKIIISVEDNGNGIPQGIMDKIFQPFFTTKPTGQGTGLGLSLSYDIVKAHGGELKVTTKEGEGSQFTIYLPLNNAK